MDTDILIVGAGCAGLSLAVHLVNAGLCDLHITILDAKTHFRRDRTWCFWDTEDHPFVEAVSHTWKRWVVAGGERHVVCRSDRHPYRHIAADDFYNLALQRIEAGGNVALRLGESVRSLEDSGDYVTVKTDSRSYRARRVFDSRPVSPKEDHYLRQHFGGLFVEADRPVFQADTVTLMHFQPDSNGDLLFIYLLPYCNQRALVEATWISARTFDPIIYRKAVEQYLTQHYDDTNWRVYDEEAGVIPMTVARFHGLSGKRITPIGLAGGLARPSTGYAFMAIQRFSAATAAWINEHGLSVQKSCPAPWTRRQRFLDRVFLAYLRRHGQDAADVFVDLFERNDPDLLVRFLTGRSTLLDDLKVMRSMPKLPFLGEALLSGIPLWSH
ncbi:MAG: lycopene cyclase family protein [Acidobacteriota bacterium]|nr:lycopene cyclase family protein [Acidobacteriota bacterium]